MLTLQHLKDGELWKSQFGLLPVPLFRDTEEEQPLVLFNGGRGNFCIDWGCYQLGDDTRSFTWSSNISHYIMATQDAFEVQRWDQPRTAIERYKFDRVAENFEKFHQYLEKTSPRQDLSVVSHVIRTFRRLRATLGNEVSGEDALRAFLYLLGSIADQSDRGNLDLRRWRLSEDAERAANIVRTNDWDKLSEEVRQGRPMQGLTPRIDLLLRHASGQLFQDAHYEAVFINAGQLSFDGFVPSPVSVGAKAKGIGIHFTPPALARAVAEEVLNSATFSQELSVFDPACGSGEFLREILRQLKIRHYRGRVKLLGWDISASACEMANFTLAWEARDAMGEVAIEICNIDSLLPQNEWPTALDIVIMNPPFVSWQDLSVDQRANLSSILGDIKEKRSDLSQAFIWKAIGSLQENGILGTIVPASFFTNESANRLRSRLKEEMQPVLLARLGSHQLFSGAIVDTAIYVAKKEPENSQSVVALWADHRTQSNSAGLRALRKLRAQHDITSYPVVGDGFSVYLDNNLGKDTNWSPRPYESTKLASNVSMLPPVKNIFEVKQGVRTGHNKVFVITKSELYNLPDLERTYFRPCVVNDSIKCGFLLDDYFVFYPYGNKSIDSEQQLQEELPIYSEKYLLPAKPRLLERPRVNPQKWWGLSEHRAWQVSDKPKLISTYFGGKGSFAWDNHGVFVVVQGYAWIPKRQSLSEEAAKGYLAIFNSDFFVRLISNVSNSVAGGQWDLSKKYVEKIALPDLTMFSESISIVDELGKVGSRIVAGLPYDEDKLEALVRAAYGLEVS